MMAERDPIELIKEQLGRADGMSGLHPEHESFKQWQNETKTILEKVFGLISIHYQSFSALRFREVTVKAFASPEIDKMNATRYRKDLENAKNLLQGAIKELMLDRTLFKKIQTTPTRVEVAMEGEYYVSPGIEDSLLIQAIEAASVGSGLKPLYGRGVVFHHRMDHIRRAKLGIYDLSGPERTEVYLEIGAALGMGREVVIMCRKGSPIPGALHSLTRIEYEDASDLAEKLRKKLSGR